MRIVAARERGVEGFLGIETQSGDAAVPCLELNQHLRKFGVARRSGDQAHVRSLLKNALAFLLGDAADHGEDFSLAVSLELVEAVKDFLLGFVANAAGVVDDQLGRFGIGDLRVTAVNERADDLFGVVRVHLAAEGLDVEGLLGHCLFIIGPRGRSSALRTGVRRGNRHRMARR